MNKVLLLIFVLFFPVLFFCQLPEKGIKEKLKDLKGLTVVKKEHSDFKEYYEIMIEQELDHLNGSIGVFKQRLFVGFNNIEAPVVIETEGYALGKASKPTFIKDCNLISVEHRYFGKSLPDSLNWDYLTIKQAAYDLHVIRTEFGKVFKGKWMSTGISKGGQTAVAYKMYFPKDVDATLAYVTPIKNGVNDKRFGDQLKLLSSSGCGEKVIAFQKFAFRHKSELLKDFDAYIKHTGYEIGKWKTETLLEYMMLEYPFAFFQNCSDCTQIPDTLGPYKAMVSNNALNEIMNVVPPRFYSESFRLKLAPSFYMFYHELGYYEYDIKPYKQWLSGSVYSNSVFAPQKNIKFDPLYLSSLNKFIQDSKKKNMIFIYGDNDPYSGLQAPVEGNKNCLKYIVKNGCHKSRISDLDSSDQRIIFENLSKWLKWPIGN